MTVAVGHRTATRVLDILEILGGSTGHTLTDLSSMLEAPKSSLLPLLRTLRNRNYITQDAAGSYHLGTKLLELSGSLNATMDLRNIAHSALVALTGTTGESTILVKLTSDRKAVVYIDKVECAHPIRAAASVGETRPLHSTSSGRLLLAYLPDEIRESLVKSIELTRYTDKTLTSRAALRKELEEIRSQGFCINIDQSIQGHCAIAAPIVDSYGEVVAACVLSAPKDRICGHIPELADELVQTAGKISLQLGHAVAGVTASGSA